MVQKAVLVAEVLTVIVMWGGLDYDRGRGRGRDTSTGHLRSRGEL
jgi:hypothetical protein